MRPALGVGRGIPERRTRARQHASTLSKVLLAIPVQTRQVGGKASLARARSGVLHALDFLDATGGNPQGLSRGLPHETMARRTNGRMK